MLIDTNIAFAIKCDICGKLQVHRLSIFDLSQGKLIELKCDCSQSSAFLKMNDCKTFWLEVPCFACQDVHVFKYTVKQLLNGNIAARCIETGMEIFFIGSEDDVDELLDKYNDEVEVLLSELGFCDYFTNFQVMVECINKIRQLDNEGKILCECGGKAIETNFYEDRIELRCTECGSIQVIYGETDEDLKSLLKKDEIFMQKHAFQCIDAINQNSDFKK